MSFSILGKYDILLLGMRAQVVSTKTSRDKRIQELNNTVRKLEEDFRDVYDSLVPNIHVIDKAGIANAISDDMSNRANYSKYFVNVSDVPLTTHAGKFGPLQEPVSYLKMHPGTELDNDEVEKVVTKSFLITLRQNIQDSLASYHAAKSKEIVGNPVIGLNNSLQVPIARTTAILEDAFLSEEVKQDAVFHLGYTLRAEVQKIFGRANIIGISAESMGVDKKFLVFFGKSFSSMVTNINKVVNTAVSQTINSSVNARGRYSTAGSSVGDIIHFGHSAIRSASDKDLNSAVTAIFSSPGFLKTAFNAVNSISGASPDLNTKYITETGHLKHSIVISKDIFQSMGALMKIGITFTQDQLAVINLDIAPIEAGLGGRGTGKELLQGTIKAKDLAQYVFKKLFQKPEDVFQGQASPSLFDLLRDNLVSILSGILPKLKQKSSSKSSGSISVPKLVPVKRTHKKLSTPKVIVNARPQSDRASNLASTSSSITPTVNLVSLQNILNQNLASRIQQNMGTGSRQDILNYRTGRFAESAKVERMSQSRQGMISAFYSYMRNPYGTFSIGGDQQSPVSRDPKLLISRSIREIGATMVNNRMRAVLV